MTAGGNVQLPVGSRVVMRDCLEAEIHNGKIWVTRSEPWRLGHGAWVVLLEGFRGGFLVDRLEMQKDRCDQCPALQEQKACAGWSPCGDCEHGGARERAVAE